MQYKNYILFIISWTWAIQLYSQELPDSTIYLNELDVNASRISAGLPGFKSTEFDSTTLKSNALNNLSDLLSNESSVFIKSYGQGSLASSSFRGGSAYHTAIIWNGISIINPLNGQLDLSLIPVAIADNITMQYGGSSSLFGSGAVAGSIHLDYNPEINNEFKTNLSLSQGSYKNYKQQLGIDLSKKRIATSLTLFNNQSKNNFSYENTYSGEYNREKLTHAEISNRALISNTQLRLTNDQILSMHAWIQTTDRNIPPTLLQDQSKAKEKDNSLRFNSEWKYQKPRKIIAVRAALLNDKINYTDLLTNTGDKSKTVQFVSEGELKLVPNHFNSFFIGINNTYIRAKHPAIISHNVQNRFTLFASYQFKSKNQRFISLVAAREEIVNNKIIPFTYSFGSQYLLAEWINIRANISKVYRLPTLSDLYWVPGGNAHLDPEDGYTMEGGMHLTLKMGKLKIESDLSLFSRKIDNWIIWLPGIRYWSPQNMLKVWSRGVETNNQINYKSGKTKFVLDILTSYVRSTNERATSENDRSLHMQLIYTPVYSGALKLTIQYSNTIFCYRHNYTGYRYVSTDNIQYLAPYDLGSLYLAWMHNYNKWDTKIFIQFNNIWNKQYQVISNRAMPGINFEAGMNIQWIKSFIKQ